MTGSAARRLLLFGALVVAVAGLFWWPRTPAPSGAAPAAKTPAQPQASASSPTAARAPAALEGGSTPPAASAVEGESAVAEPLNAPGGSIQRDLAILDEVFAMWLTNFPREGNPVGENAEITAALTGENVHRFAFIPRRHRAINAQGELCDRWGTPFRFHQLSGRQMEIRSAGPDRKFGTQDDATSSPP